MLLCSLAFRPELIPTPASRRRNHTILLMTLSLALQLERAKARVRVRARARVTVKLHLMLRLLLLPLHRLNNVWIQSQPTKLRLCSRNFASLGILQAALAPEETHAPTPTSTSVSNLSTLLQPLLLNPKLAVPHLRKPTHGRRSQLVHNFHVLILPRLVLASSRVGVIIATQCGHPAELLQSQYLPQHWLV